MRRLTQCVLASGCLIAAALPNYITYAAQNIPADAPNPTALDATGKATGVDFSGALASTLEVGDGDFIGNTLGVSASISNPLAQAQIIFKGSSVVTGSITATPLPPPFNAVTRVNILELQGGLGKTVTLNGITVLNPVAGSNIKFTTNAGTALIVNQNLFLGTIDFGGFGANSTVTFADGVDFTGGIDTSIASTGSVFFDGSSTVTGGVFGATKSLAEVQIGPGTVYLNTPGNTFTADAFNFVTNTGSNTLQIGNTTNITGNIDNKSTIPGSGTLLFDQNSTVTGNIGTTSPLGLIRLSAPAATTVTLSGNVFANTTQLQNTIVGADNTLILTAPGATTSTVATNIITNADQVGIIRLDKVGTFTGNIGSSTQRVKSVEVGANNDTSLIGNIFVSNGVQFTGNNTLTVGAGNFINGSVVTNTNGKGKLVFAGSSQSYGVLGQAGKALNSVSFNGGTFNLNTDIYATNVEVKNSATLVFNQDTTLSNNLSLDATGGNLNIGNNTVNIGNDFTTQKNSLITLDLASVTKFGNLVVGNKAELTNAPIWDITTSGYVPSGTTFKILNATGGINPALAVGTLKNTSTLLSNFALSQSLDNKIINLTVTRNTNTSISDYPFTAGVAGALDAIQNSGLVNNNPDFFKIIDQLDNFTDRASFNEALATLAPSVDGDNKQGMMAMTRLSMETVRKRLDEYRLGQLDYLQTGYAASSYDPLKDYGVWVKLMASRFKQSEYKGIAGYKSDIWGIGFGVDYTSPDNEIVYGVGFNYVTTDTLSRATAASQNTIDSYSLMLYGTYNFNNPWYVDAIVYFTQHNYQPDRHISVGAVSDSARADYDAWQLSARAETGFVYQYNKILFQPTLSLFYAHLDRDNYTETGAGAIGLVVRPRDINSVVASIGPKISTVLGSEGASLIPEFHAYYNYEMANSKEQYLSNFIGGGPLFETDGIEGKRSSYTVGVGLAAYGFENLSCHVNINYEFNETKFSAFYGSLKFEYTW